MLGGLEGHWYQQLRALVPSQSLSLSPTRVFINESCNGFITEVHKPLTFGNLEGPAVIIIPALQGTTSGNDDRHALV